MRRSTTGLVLGVMAFWCLTARAQVPTPRVRAVYPPGGRAGETVEVQLIGDDLEGVNCLWLDHPGLRAFHVKGATYRIVVATGVPPGHHDLIAHGPEGLSNPWTFVVSDHPERAEIEPNDEPAQAGTIQLGETLDGRAEKPADLDTFAFEGQAGQRVVVQLNSRTLGSRLDGSLRLIGPDGGAIAEAVETAGSDPVLEVALPSAGRHLIQVQDVTYAGSPEHVYRLTLHDAPRVLAMAPSAAVSGAVVEVTLLGRGLGGTPVEGQLIEGQPLESRKIELRVPAMEDLITADPGTEFVPAPLYAGPGWRIRAEGAACGAAPLSLVPTTDPVVREVEPNDPDAPQAVTPPCVISGCWGAPEDRDAFRFAGKKGEVWWIEVVADRLGSPADPALVVQRVTDAERKDVANADDVPGPEPSPDPALRFAVAEDGVYQVVIHDLFGAQRGDARSRYALEIRPERPDFRLYVAPGGAAVPPVGLTLRPGGRAELQATITRLEGFNGAVRIEAIGLPPGVTAEPIMIPAGQTTAPLVLTAVPEANPAIGPLRIEARSLSPDRKEVLTYAPGSSRVTPERVRAATAFSPIWAPVQNPNGGAASVATRATKGLILGVADSDAPFRLNAAPGEVVVTAGEAVELAVEVVRREGFTEAVQVATAVLPPNVGAANVAIAKEATTGTLKLTVPQNLAPGTYTVLLRGTAPFATGMGKKGGRRRNANAVEPSNTVQLRVIK